MEKGKGKHSTMILNVENETENETGIFINEKGITQLKDSASKLLLTVAYKKQLQGDYSQAEQIFKNVNMNCSDSFNIDSELAAAQKNAVKSLI